MCRTALGQPGRQRMQAPRKSDVQAIGQEGDEDVRLNACLELVKDRPDRQVALEVFERLLDRHQQQIMAPQLGGVFLDEIGAQQIPAFARSYLAQVVAIEPIAEGGAVCGDLDHDQAPFNTVKRGWAKYALSKAVVHPTWSLWRRQREATLAVFREQ